MSRTFRFRAVGLLTLWGGLSAGALIALERYRMTPASAGAAVPSAWPAVTEVPLDPTHFTLVMSLHPHCACSRATLGELAILMARAAGRVSAELLFVAPPQAPADWAQTDLWRQAREIPGVIVRVDRGGLESARFAATVSGECRLYDARGLLLFSGGITPGRGHEGDNIGLSSIVSLCEERPAATTRSSVYGCGLTHSDDRPFWFWEQR